MALDVGADFKKRWLNAPQAVRQTYLNDLTRICELLDHETRLDNWLSYNKQAQLESYGIIEQTYTDLKAQLIEEARVRKQCSLEKSLADKREQQQQFVQQLHQDEQQQFSSQTETLQHLQHQVLAEFQDYSARYQKNQVQKVAVTAPKVQAKPATMVTPEIQEALDNLKIRLELEAESLIEQIEAAVKGFNLKLQQAAEEEISYLLKQDKNTPPKE